MTDQDRQLLAEELRITYKELGWLRTHIKNIHALLTPTTPIEEVDKNQLSLFPKEGDPPPPP